MGELGVIVPSGLRWLYVQGYMRLCIVLSTGSKCRAAIRVSVLNVCLKRLLTLSLPSLVSLYEQCQGSRRTKSNRTTLTICLDTASPRCAYCIYLPLEISSLEHHHHGMSNSRLATLSYDDTSASFD